MTTKSVPKPKPPARVEPLRLIEQQLEFIAKADIDTIPRGMRGIYVLYRTVDSGIPRRPHRHVVYVGMSASGIRGRLRSHRKHKDELWDTCSIFVVWPNVREEEIRELEGILRHISRFDPDAQQLNAQGAYKKLSMARKVETKESYRKEVELIENDLADQE